MNRPWWQAWKSLFRVSSEEAGRPSTSATEPTTPSGRVYLPASEWIHRRVGQGEIVANAAFGLSLMASKEAKARTFDIPWSVVVSQDCDLERDHEAIAKHGPPPLYCALLCEALPWAEFPKGDRRLFETVNSNQNASWQFLEAGDAASDPLGEGVTALAVHFQRLFPVDHRDLRAQIDAGTAVRKARLAAPYLEHLSARLCHYQARVALPRDHGKAFKVQPDAR